jgi:competence protein ComEA
VEPSPAPWRAFETAEPPSAAPTGGVGAAAPTADPSAALVPRAIVFGALAVMLLLGAGAAALASGGGDGSNVIVGAAGSLDPGPDGGASELVVDVAGAVVRPGVYHLARGARIGDAIEAAGGYGPRVDAARASAELNLAALLEDGQHVVVPSRDSAGGSTGGGGSGSGGSGAGGGTEPVDLNMATEAELEALPGIGPATAAKIIASRETTRFTAVQDLRDRKLVGQKTFDGLKDLVTVR